MSELRVHDAMWILDPMARRVRRRLSVLEHDELVSVGYIALRKASETFDPTLGVAFSSYAWMRVFGAMLDVARKHVNVASRVHGACLQAITLLGDTGDIMRDDETQHCATAAEFLSAVAVAMHAAVLSEHRGTQAGGGLDEALDRARASARLRDALDTLPEDRARLIVSHYHEATTLRSIAERHAISYRTAKRVHNEALRALAAALGASLPESRSLSQAPP